MKVIVTRPITTSIDVLVLSICVYDAMIRSPVDSDTTRIKFASLLTVFQC